MVNTLKCVLKEARINNFKSLKDLRVSLDRFNVIVGRNASGKTNFVEFFRFLKNALVEERRPYMPYIEWWSYHNIVWEGKEQLPIVAGLKFEIDGYDVDYEVVFSIAGGIFSILDEQLTIDRSVFVERRGQLLKIRHSEEFIKANVQKVQKLLDLTRGFPFGDTKKRITKDYLLGAQVRLPTDFSNLIDLPRTLLIPMLSTSYRDMSISCMLDLGSPRKVEEPIVIILPAPKTKKAPPPVMTIFDGLRSAINNFIVLKHPSMKEVKSPSAPRKEEVLSEDATNLHNILFYWFQKEGGKIPERIERGLTKLFPNIQIRPSLTSDGKVFIKMYDKGIELDPPCIPDGLYKILTVLAAIELKPSLLAVDEIENSLYAEALEYVIDELKNSETTVIVTTHSPLVVDMVKLEDLFIVERTAEGTVLKKIENPEEIREKLKELKITQSESWIYGGLSERHQKS